MLNFENTEIAFRQKGDGELKQAYRLFKLMNNGILANLAPRLIEPALRLGLPITSLVKKTLYKQFCGGETIEECEESIRQLDKGYVGAILDYSVEGAIGENSYSFTADEIIKTIRHAKNDRRIPFAVFKPSGVVRFKLLEKVSSGKPLSNAEQVEYFKAKGRINNICKTAYDLEVPVMFDAEESWIQKGADAIALDMMRLYNRDQAIVYNTYQLYRNNKLASLQSDLFLAEREGFILGAKLVRGAYLEKERARAEREKLPSPIYNTKEDTDKAFNEALVFCVENLKDLAFIAGTHNEASCMILTELMKKHNLPEDHPNIYFAQLLGMSDNLSFNLAFHGYNVVKYVPYGPVKSVLPYLFRRAEENKAITGQMGRELTLLSKEKKRRGI
ncbi:proline dehydrogenase family protein [Desertivirga arenae]|uniref:proline dehydrogenase family protein n=1 Tax=Desertivirga arenae TaxID=2810309 RepID=UPI001F60F1B5|nr:proline dehydrogenase family protein [Pedobacter sp. SYSU D00823]